MTKRKMKNTGWVNYKKHPRGPHGRGLCRMCGKEVPKGRRTFCGEICVHQYRLRNSNNYQAKHLRDRDAGVCDICGINADIVLAKYREEISKAYKDSSETYWHIEEKEQWLKEVKEKRKIITKIKNNYKEQGWPMNRTNRWWDVDHIVPVVEGGGPQDWPKDKDYGENLRTLCVPCHKAETKKLKERLSSKS